MGIRVGFHVSIAGGISNSVDNARKIRCTAFQIFSRNPRGWAAKPLVPDDVQLFKTKLEASGIDRNAVIVHMPYLPNLSGPDGEFHKKSIDTLAEELQRCGALGIPWLVIHLGSHMGRGTTSGVSQLVKAIKTARAISENGPVVLLENNTGQKNSIGGNFEELRLILDNLDDPKEFGVCMDTCHVFAAGYALGTKAEVDRTLEKFDNMIGLKELKFIHLNDSKGLLGSNLDRHEHIGLGMIGSAGLTAFLNHRAIRGLPVIMETPIDEKRGDEQNLKLVLGMVK
jgi:deoxyribonuclease IV